MTANDPMITDTQRLQDRKRKRKAILAGGVVLGLGAAITLAAWSDDVFADGIFYTGSFELQGNTTDTGTVDNTTTGWDDMDAGAEGTLQFDQPAQLLVPDVEVYAPIALRLSNDTTADAASLVLSSVQITAGSPQALNTNLDYAVYVGADATSCVAGTPGTADASGTINNTVASSTFGTLTAPSDSTSNDQTVVPVCLGVTLNSNEEDVQGVADTTVRWQFTATSVE